MLSTYFSNFALKYFLERDKTVIARTYSKYISKLEKLLMLD